MISYEVQDYIKFIEILTKKNILDTNSTIIPETIILIERLLLSSYEDTLSQE